MKNIRVVICFDTNKNFDNFLGMTDSEVMDFGEQVGDVYSLIGFQNALNNDEIVEGFFIMRIIDLSPKEELFYTVNKNLFDTQDYGGTFEGSVYKVTKEGLKHIGCYQGREEQDDESFDVSVENSLKKVFNHWSMVYESYKMILL